MKFKPATDRSSQTYVVRNSTEARPRYLRRVTDALDVVNHRIASRIADNSPASELIELEVVPNRGSEIGMAQAA